MTPRILQGFIGGFYAMSKRLDYMQAQLDFILLTIINRSNQIMSTVNDLQAAIDAAVAATATEQAQVQAALAAQAASIQALTDQIAQLQAGSVVTQAELDALVVAAQGIAAAVDAIYTP